MTGQALQDRGDFIPVSVKRAELTRQIVRVLSDFLDQCMNLAGFLRAWMIVLFRPPLESFCHKAGAGQFLAEIIVEIETNAAALVFRNFEELVFQPPPLLE